MVLIIAGAAGYAILTVKPAGDAAPAVEVATSTATRESSPLILQGTVTGVDAVKMQITLQVSTTSPLKVITISPATKIEKVISQKGAKGAEEKRAVMEVNIEDVQKGSIVTITYQSEKDGVLSGVSRVSSVVDGNIDAYFKSQAANQTPYLKVQVVAIDTAGKILQYKPVMFNTVSTTTVSVAIPDGIPVYRVDDPLLVPIIHARTVVALTDIRPDQIIFIMTDAKSIKAGKIVPRAFVILEK